MRDREGDAHMSSGDPAPGYLDQVGAAVVVGDEETLRFVEELAAPFPADAPVPRGDAAIGWSFCLDTDPDRAAVGFPMEGVRPCEFVLRVRWTGQKSHGFFIDRRPLLEGRYAMIQTLDVTWRGTSMQVQVPLEKLGYADTFEWSVATEEFRSLNNDLVYQVDELPDGGIASPAMWQAE